MEEEIEDYYKTAYGFVVAVFMDAARGQLTETFRAWDLRDRDGWSVALEPTGHEAARYNNLPENFNQWDIKSGPDEWTVAHEASMYGKFKPDFDQWWLADKDGWTVAHTAARFEHLPEDFSQWDLTDKEGRTVAAIAKSTGGLSAVLYAEWMLKNTFEGETQKESHPTI
jgi:hypothetical protein